MSIYHIIYKTTNLVNQKFYIGKHSTTNLDDNYLGSGLILNHAIKKYGVSAFHREILSYHNTPEELNIAEQKIVNTELISNEMCYNLVLGGHGGKIILDSNHPRYEEVKQTISNSKKGFVWWTNGTDDRQCVDPPDKSWHRGRTTGGAVWDDKRKLERAKLYQSGKMFWWNDGSKNKRQVECPGDGWVRGRLKSSMPDAFVGKKVYARKFDTVVLKELATGKTFTLSYDELKDFKKENKNIVGQELKPRKRAHLPSIKYVIIEKKKGA